MCRRSPRRSRMSSRSSVPSGRMSSWSRPSFRVDVRPGSTSDGSRRSRTALTGVAARTGAILIDTDLHPSLPDRPNWGEDLVAPQQPRTPLPRLSGRRGALGASRRRARCPRCGAARERADQRGPVVAASCSPVGVGVACTDAQQETGEWRSTTTTSTSGAPQYAVTSPRDDPRVGSLNRESVA